VGFGLGKGRTLADIQAELGQVAEAVVDLMTRETKAEI
jgi:hypothetical protein